MSLTLAPAAEPSLPLRLAAAGLAALGRQQGRRAPWLAVALGAGVLAYFAQDQEPGLGALWIAGLAAAAALLAVRRGPWLAWLLGLVAAGALGFGGTAWHAARQPPALVLPASAVILSGTVASLHPLPEGVRVALTQPRLNDGEAEARHLRLRLRADDPTRPQPGDAIRVRAMVRTPPGPVSPEGWDFARAAWFSGLGGSATALGPVDILPGGGAPPPLAGLRATLDQQVGQRIGDAAGAVAAALLTGTQSAIPAADLGAMRDSGLSHLLSVSGLHMTIVMGLVFGALRIALAAIPYLALRLPGKAVAALGALAAGAFYMVLTGSQVPMQRCLAMAALVTLGLLAGRRAISARALALAASLVLVLAPAELLGPSFQMSFAAVLALVAGHQALGTPMRALRARLPAPVAGPAMVLLGVVATSVLAGLATAPIGLHHFGRLQVYGVLANAVAVPITTFWVMPAGLLSVLLLPLGLDSWPLAVMGWGVEAILAVAHGVAAWPGAAPAQPGLPGAGLALAAFGFCWLCLWRGAPRLLGVPIIAAGLLAGMVVRPADMLVSADGRMVAFRTEQGGFLHRLPGASGFARDSWARSWGLPGFQPLPEAAPGLTCSAKACRFRPRPDAVEAVLLITPPMPRGARRGTPPDPALLAASCGTAGLLLATEPLRPRCATGAVIDRFTLWREGSHAIWLGPHGVRILSEAEARGDRPWVPPPPMPGRPDTLPMAPRDVPAVTDP
jgi:competence protein ComEC